MPLTLFHQKLPCVSIAPFGRPVVPEVYMIIATSSSPTRTGSVGGAALVRPVRLVLGGEKSLERRQPLALRLDDGAELSVDDERARRAILDHEGEFRPGQAEIERHENRPEPRRGEHDEEEHRLVEAEEGDALALADPKRREPRGAILDRRCISA